MPVPKQRRTSRTRDARRSHDALDAPARSVCPQCHQAKLPHRVCPSCGYYAGKEIIETE